MIIMSGFNEILRVAAIAKYAERMSPEQVAMFPDAVIITEFPDVTGLDSTLDLVDHSGREERSPRFADKAIKEMSRRGIDILSDEGAEIFAKHLAKEIEKQEDS